MSGKHLPIEDHAARYCPGSKLSENGEVSGTAFHLRQGEPYVSVEWLEYLNLPSRDDEVRGIADILAHKLRLGASAKIAVLNVGEVCGYVEQASGFYIRFLHEPEPLDPAHSGIHDTAQDEILICELIAETVAESYPAK